VAEPATPAEAASAPTELDDDDDEGPPDPYEEAARLLDRAMTESVRKTRRARRLSSESSDSVDSDVGTLGAADDLDGLVEVVQVPAGGTSGRGSRTYERDQVMPAADQSGKKGDETPTGTIDLDWLALIEDAPLDDDGASVSRVIIKLPEAAAPTEGASAEQVRQFHEAVQKLEQGNSSSVGELLSPEDQARADQDTRSWKSDPETKPFSRDDVDVDDQEVTRPGGWRHGQTRDETTKPWKKESLQPSPAPAEDKTADWEGEPDDKTVEWAREAAASSDPETKSWPEKESPPTPFPGLAAESDEAPTAKHIRPISSRARMESTQALEVHFRLPPSDRQASAYQALFNQLFAGKNGDAPNSLLVTSPAHKDGKTTVAVNLALVAARQLNEGVVLIDADPLGEGVLRAFGIRSRKEGLLEALQGDGDSEEYARPLKVGCPLDLVPLGIPSSDAQDLLCSGRMHDFLKVVQRDFPGALLVIDTAPALEAAPQSLAHEVDGVLLVVRAGATPRQEVARSVEAIGRNRILGVVLNDAREGI
jgi:Mrp family chromosome partitioning ATPase